MLSEIFREVNDGLEFSVYLTPGSEREAVNGIFQDEFGRLSLKISVHSRPTNNEANEALMKFISSLFRIAKSKIMIKQGQKSRRKVLYIKSISVADVPAEIRCIANSYRESIKKQLSLF